MSVTRRKSNAGFKKEDGAAGGGWEIIYTGFVLILLLFFGLSSPFFYLIVFTLWIIVMWHFINSTFSLLDSEPEA